MSDPKTGQALARASSSRSICSIRQMTSSWAYIYGQPGVDPATDRFVLERDGQRTTLVPVPDESAAAQVAVELVDGGVELIELCGGFSVQNAARVIEAVGGRVPVGHVTFGFESLTSVAAYKARFEAQYGADDSSMETTSDLTGSGDRGPRKRMSPSAYCRDDR